MVKVFLQGMVISAPASTIRNFGTDFPFRISAICNYTDNAC